MVELASDNKFWVWIGKLSAIVALVLGVITIVKTCSAPTIALQATVERGSFYLPPRYTEFREKVNSTLTTDNIEATFKGLLEDKEGKEPPNEFTPLTFALARALREQLKLDNFTLDSAYVEYWDAEIANTGGLSVSEVSLRLPGATIATIEKEDGSKKTDSNGPIIEIGSVGAGQKVKVLAWSESYSYTNEKPAIYHAGGPGAITVKNEPTITEFASQHLAEILVYIFSASLVLVVLMAGIKISREVRGSKSTEKPPAEPGA